METIAVTIPEKEIERQRDYTARVREILTSQNRHAKAMVDTYGCQQNEADSQRLRGLLNEMGCEIISDPEQADIILINSCAIREHAEDRVFGNIGALSHAKRANPNLIIGLCGCMAAEAHVQERIKKSYPYVNFTFPPDALWRLPEMLYNIFIGNKRIFAESKSSGSIAEGIPELRDMKYKAWVSIMYGCNNFCSYCIVPYVRGRERSRKYENIKKEVRELVCAGYKDITLLGQNVNSYGKGSGEKINFSQLLEKLNSIEGDFLIRFMTSHPKDASSELLEIMSRCDKVARHLHLPFQAGNDDVLKRMNRGYSAKQYVSLIDRARELMPDIVLTSDVIVGFPGETDAQFEDTLKLVEKVRFDSLFTFIYSPRIGTPAAKLPDPFTREEKQKRFNRLIELQNAISAEKHTAYLGKTMRVLIDGHGQNNLLSARTNGGRLVHLNGDEKLIGTFQNVKITDSSTWALFGEVI